MIGHSISDTDLVRAEFEPKKVLMEELRTKSLLQTYRSKLPDLDLSSIKELPVIRELNHFLQGSRLLVGGRRSR